MQSDSLQFIEIYSTSKEWIPHLPQNQRLHHLPTLSDFKRTLFSESYSLLILQRDTLPKELLAFVKTLPENLEQRVKIIYFSEVLTSEDIELLSEIPQLEKIINPHTMSVSYSDLFSESLKLFSGLLETDGIMGKVRAQNKTLNELNENLEKIIDQRTEHFELSKSEVEAKNKETRDLIKFIKSISNVDGFEDLILILKHEFLKYHKVETPLLLYSLSPSAYRCVYLQGPQIVDRIVEIKNIQTSKVDPARLREILADTLARPISPILCVSLAHHPEHTGLLIFEHNMDSLEQSYFMEVLERRVEPLRVAFDRLALKWKAHQISRQWSSTFDALEDPIVIIDQNYKVIRANKKFSEIPESSCFKTFTKRDQTCVGCPVNDAIAKKSAQTGRISKDDRMYEVHAYPIKLDPAERAVHMIVHYTDATQPMKLQGQIIQSEKMAALGLLAGNIAHELNNPLTGIKSLAQILISETKNEEALCNDLIEVEGAAQRSESIIKNLLEFSSQQAAHKDKISLSEIVHKTLPFLKATMRYHNCHLELQEGNDVVEVEAQLLQQVIFNLVNNACQAMGDTGDLTIKTQTIKSESEDLIQLSVIDTGPGVPVSLQEAIFAPFFTTKEEGEGTGLGLSMSRAIVKKFGGQLFLNSEITVGSEFIIQLPRVHG